MLRAVDIAKDRGTRAIITKSLYQAYAFLMLEWVGSIDRSPRRRGSAWNHVGEERRRTCVLSFSSLRP
jgi:hypothetical protein